MTNYYYELLEIHNNYQHNGNIAPLMHHNS